MARDDFETHVSGWFLVCLLNTPKPHMEACSSPSRLSLPGSLLRSLGLGRVPPGLPASRPPSVPHHHAYASLARLKTTPPPWMRSRRDTGVSYSEFRSWLDIQQGSEAVSRTTAKLSIEPLASLFRLSSLRVFRAGGGGGGGGGEGTGWEVEDAAARSLFEFSDRCGPSIPRGRSCCARGARLGSLC